MVSGLGSVLRFLPIQSMKGATQAALAGMAYDLLYGLQANVWKWRNGVDSWEAMQEAWRGHLSAMDLQLPPAPEVLDPIRVLCDNAEAFDVRTELYEKATETIDLATYCIYADATGWRTVEELSARARAGVRVRVVLDDGVCTRKTAEDASYTKILDTLTAAGIQVIRYRDPVRPLEMNHRKLLIVDAKTAVIGGRNYGDYYSGPKWRDLDLVLTGEVAARCGETFDALCAYHAGTAPLPVPTPYASLADGIGRCAEHRSGLLQVNPVLLWQLACLDAAQEEVVIENAYIIVHDVLLERVKAAVERGVRVRLFTNSPASNDVKTIAYGFFSRLVRLAEAGAEIHLRQGAGRTVHSKYMVTDRRLVSVGSYNLNAHSARLAAECNVQLDHPDVAEELRTYFESGIEGATPITSADQMRQLVPNDPISRMVDSYLHDCQ